MMFAEIRDPAERVRAICQRGCEVQVKNDTKPDMYLRSGQQMLRAARSYQRDGDFESAFILYSKFTTLFIEKLPNHVAYATVDKKLKDKNKQDLKEALSSAEKIKQKLLEKYEQEEQARRKAEALMREDEKRKLAEQRARDAKRREDEEQQKVARRQERGEERLAEQESAYRRLQEEEVQRQRMRQLEDRTASLAINATGRSMSLTDQQVNGIAPVWTMDDYRPTSPSSSSVRPPPAVDRSTKPSMDHFMSVGRVTGNRYGLRDVVVPHTISERFLSLARDNTTRNIETCGILCGSVLNGSLRVTHVIVPKQTGTPDSCVTENEEEIFDALDKYDLITLGWIHTHPSQTAFLSSVDLHTHCSYQLMLPEAIAIVCAPKFNETGFFALTPDHGLDLVSSCNKSGFHPHPTEPPLFENCAHVRVDAAASVTVIDLRRQ